MGFGGSPFPFPSAEAQLGLHQAEETPPPIQGGTLTVTADGALAVAADPARDRVSLVNLDSLEARHVELEDGEQPGRVVEDASGRLHVVLRGTGQIASIDAETADVTERRAVCASLQGLGFHAGEQALLATCANGELVTLPAAGGEPTRRDFIDDDLRDVWVQQDRIQVSRFKSAEVLTLDADRAVTNRTRPGNTTSIAAGEERTLTPTTAWRVSGAADAAYMIHQSAQIDPIDLDEGQTDRDGAGGAGGFSGGSGGTGFPMSPSTGSSPYGGGANGCGIVQSALDRIDSDGQMERSATRIPVGLAVDVAVSQDGRFLALALPGTSIHRDGSAAGFSTLLLRMEDVFGADATQMRDCGALPIVPGMVAIQGGAQVTAVAFDDRGRLWMQSREPATLQVVSPDDVAGSLVTSSVHDEVPLSEDSMRDTGHDLFHMVTGAGIACASCHPGGAEDGHVWRFEPIGPRRSQALHVGLEGTAPFHWDGDQDSVTALMSEVFVRRMGGPEVSDEQAQLLEEWMFELQPPAPKRATSEAAAQRGKALFESDQTQCATCHTPPAFTNNQSADVGTGGVFQVPSLVGVGYRAPLMHDGCAEDLHARFEDTACGGGDEHGKTSHLTAAQVDDLVAYLEAI